MNKSNHRPSYSDKFYNVKILKVYVAYLKEKCGWSDEKLEHLFELCGCDITFIDSEDNWFTPLAHSSSLALFWVKRGLIKGQNVG